MEANILDYGAKPNNTKFDNSSVFQKAEDEMSTVNGTVYVPTGKFYSSPFYHRSNVTLNGDGDSSVIINNKLNAPGSGKDYFCIYIGNFKPSDYNKCLHIDIGDLSMGIKVIDVPDISKFHSGQLVLINSTDGYINSDGEFKPYHAFINKVIGIRTKSVVLEDAILYNIRKARIAPTDIGFDTSKTYICERPTITNIRFESLGNWAERFGVYKGVLDNISMKTTDVLGGNGFAFCNINKIRAKFSQKVAELATYSHNTRVTNVNAKWWNGFKDPDKKPLIKLGECQRDCLFDNINIDSADSDSFDNVIRYSRAAFSNEIKNSVFYCSKVIGAGISHEGDSEDAYIMANNTHNNKFFLGSTKYYIYFEGIGTANVSTNKVNENIFSGKVSEDVHLDNVGSSLNDCSGNTYNH